jgi:hypothetical protein
MSDEDQRTVGDLIRKIQRARAFLRPTNPHNRLLSECEQCITDLALQLYEARGGVLPSSNRVEIEHVLEPARGREAL